MLFCIVPALLNTLPPEIRMAGLLQDPEDLVVSFKYVKGSVYADTDGLFNWFYDYSPPRITGLRWRVIQNK